MTPKQQTMKEICDILHAQAQQEGKGLDYEMFTKKNMRLGHSVLLACLANLKTATAQTVALADEDEKR